MSPASIIALPPQDTRLSGEGSEAAAGVSPGLGMALTSLLLRRGHFALLLPSPPKLSSAPSCLECSLHKRCVSKTTISRGPYPGWLTVTRSALFVDWGWESLRQASQAGPHPHARTPTTLAQFTDGAPAGKRPSCTGHFAKPGPGSPAHGETEALLSGQGMEARPEKASRKAQQGLGQRIPREPPSAAHYQIQAGSQSQGPSQRGSRASLPTSSSVRAEPNRAPSSQIAGRGTAGGVSGRVGPSRDPRAVGGSARARGPPPPAPLAPYLARSPGAGAALGPGAPGPGARR